MNIFIFLFFSLLALISVLGYGSFFRSYIIKLNNSINLGIIGFLGLFFLSSISYFSHLFFPHNYLHNSLILGLGLIFFWFYFYKKVSIPKLNYFILLFLIIGIFIAKTNDDFPYYHLPNALQFSQNKLELGLGNLNHGFKHHSSIFYLYSLFNLPLIKFYIFNVLNFFFLLFGVYYFLGNIIEKIKLDEFNLDEVLKLFFLIVIISIFNRIAAYGTDITGQILAIVLFSIFFELIKKENLIKFNHEKIFVFISLFTYLITIKTYFIIYSLLPISIFYLSNIKKLMIKEIFFSKVLLFSSLSILIMIIINISSTGCLIYPIKSLCFPETFFWGLKIETVQYLSNWYEIWSKAGAGPDFRVQGPEQYILGLNWLNNWIDRYFFNKVSDFLLSISLCMIIFSFLFWKNIEFKKYQKRSLISLVIIFSLLLFWFFNFPSLRYGGYSLSIIFVSILFSNCFNFTNIDFATLKKKIVILVALALTVFFSKNVIRINKEFNYQAVDYFKSFPFYYIKNVDYSKEYINDELVYKVNDACWITPSPCVRKLSFKIKKFLNYRVYLD